MGKTLKSASSPLGVVTNIATGGLASYDPDKGLRRGVLSEAANQLTGGSVSKIGKSLTDTVLGKKSEATPDEVIDLASPQGRLLQEQLLSEYGGMLGQDGVSAQISAQEAQARQLAKDQEMRARQLIAQRGMGRTASGIGSILGQQRNLGEQISAIRAQAPQLQREQLGFLTSGINQILSEQGQSKALKMGQQGGVRRGGFAPLLGAAVGGILGKSPQAAQVGMGVGQSATQLG